MPKLENKVAVVTGGSRGIGAAIAKRLGADGATVIVNYTKSADAAKRIVDEINQAGGKAEAIQADISVPTEITAFIEKVANKHNRIDILVNNAGTAEFQPLESITEGHIDKQFDLNVKGLLLTTQAAVAHFPATGGNVVNISSTVGTKPMPYAASILLGKPRAAGRCGHQIPGPESAWTASHPRQLGFPGTGRDGYVQHGG